MLLAIPTIVGVSLFVFFSLRLMPGTVVDVLQALEPSMNADQAATLRRTLGIDAPPHEQFLNWVRALAMGDLGTSFYSSRSVTELIASRLPITLELGLLAIAISVSLAFPLGIVSALWPNTVIDYIVRTFSV